MSRFAQKNRAADARLARNSWSCCDSLKPGDSIRIVQTIRVGARQWESRTDGVFREIAYLQTGITTERVKEDDLVVPIVRFTKPNGELSSISIDENTKVTRL